MADLNKIVNINITKSTTPLSIKGFGTPNVYGENLIGGSTRFAVVTALSQVAALVTGGTASNEYKVCAGIFSAPNPPVEVLISKKLAGDATITAGLDALIVVNNDWYGFMYAELRTDIPGAIEASNWVATNEKLMFAGSDDANITGQDLVTDTTTFAKLTKNAANFRVANVVSGDTVTFAEGAYAGDTLSRLNIGGYTMAHKSISLTVVADVWDPTEQKNAWDKFCSTYEPIGAGNRLMMSWVGDGDYVDTIIFIDWLKARLQESLVFLLQTVDKVPYNNEGYTQIINAMDPIFKQAKTNGAIGDNLFDPITGLQVSGYVINVPNAFDIPIATRATRNMTGTTFTAWYTIAGHTIEITGNVTI